jgi:hypothetical protein
MAVIIWTKEGRFEAVSWLESGFVISQLHSPNEETPAFEHLSTGHKQWYFEGKLHRESGPAKIWTDEEYSFWLNDKVYENVNDWLIDNPNKDKTFQVQMILKYS